MGTEPKKPREEVPAPSRAARLAWWFGIYLAAQVPLMIHGFTGPNGWFFPFFFPWILGTLLAPFLSILPNSLQTAADPLFFVAGYAFYLGHLYAILKARTRRRFDFWLLVLVIVVLANQWLIASMARAVSN